VPKKLTFTAPEKTRELARRGEARETSEARQMLELAFEQGGDLKAVPREVSNPHFSPGTRPHTSSGNPSNQGSGHTLYSACMASRSR
jgi:hypothetical protein